MSHVLVVGAGHVGLPCAVGLAAAGARVTVVEVDQAHDHVARQHVGVRPLLHPGDHVSHMGIVRLVDHRAFHGWQAAARPGARTLDLVGGWA